MKLTETLILTMNASNGRSSTIESWSWARYLQGEQVGPMLHALVDREYIPAGATQVHGIRNEDVSSPKWPEVIRVEAASRPLSLMRLQLPPADGLLIDAENHRNDIPWSSRDTDPFVWVMAYRGLPKKTLRPCVSTTV